MTSEQILYKLEDGSMSADNQTNGYELYKKGEESLISWFHEQWKHWPTRVNPNNTTNLSFHFGGILAYREIHKKEPEISNDLKSSIKWSDRYNNHKGSTDE